MWWKLFGMRYFGVSVFFLYFRCHRYGVADATMFAWILTAIDFNISKIIFFSTLSESVGIRISEKSIYWCNVYLIVCTNATEKTCNTISLNGQSVPCICIWHVNSWINGIKLAGSVVDCKNHHLHRLIHWYLMIRLFVYANVVYVRIYWCGTKKGQWNIGGKKTSMENSNNRSHRIREKGSQGEKKIQYFALICLTNQNST